MRLTNLLTFVLQIHSLFAKDNHQISFKNRLKCKDDVFANAVVVVVDVVVVVVAVLNESKIFTHNMCIPFSHSSICNANNTSL